jgi:mono/diheme cytochrome c family protein
MTRWTIVAAIVGLALLGIVATIATINLRDESPIEAVRDVELTPARVQRGAYLVRAGNCISCHTARGGAAFAGGRAIETPFGTLYGSNITPDVPTGIGAWSSAEFWRALHNGRSKDGRLLVPAFPYPNYTLVTREDADAMYAYLRTVRPVAQANRRHDLRFPYNTQAALAVWRVLYFRPGTFRPVPTQSPEWNRGAYLVRGLTHCSACHGGRTLFGRTRRPLELSGGVTPIDKWYAPSLQSDAEAGVSSWEIATIIDLFKTGVSERGSVLGPMAEVVYRSTQHLTDADLGAMAVYLRALPSLPTVPQRDAPVADDTMLERGAAVYRNRCEGCHGAQGQGARGAYPALAGNRAVLMEPPTNVIRAVLSGGFQPATAGNPRPWGMPPFGHVLDDADVAAVVTLIRNHWGNRASAVSVNEVQRLR